MFINNKAVIIMLSLVFTLLIISCVGNTQTKEGNNPEMKEKPVLMKADELNNEPILKTGDSIKITASRFKFEPDKITIQKGAKVKIIAESTDTSHGFAIKEYNINVELPPNVEKTIEFTADKAGTFTFFCSVFCGSGHRDMRGTLIVQ